MHIPNLFHTYPGMYMTQSFLHALIATVITGGAIEAWNIESPRIRQRFRLSVILFSIFSFPVYQAIDADRNSVFFRAEALFDSMRWLDMELWNMIPLHLFLVLIFAATTLVFVFQEMFPIIRHFAVPAAEPHVEVSKPSMDSLAGRSLKPLVDLLPELFIIQDDEPLLFSTTLKNPAIYLSTGLTKQLSPEQLQAAVAHEIAHVARSKRPVLLAGFFLRTLMFFNPVVLVEFRRAIRNEEKICDDIAVSITGKPLILAETLKKFHLGEESGDEPDSDRHPLKTNLEEYSHMLQLESRIARLEHASLNNKGGDWFPFFLSFALIIVINFYVV
jgi:hypothetical protein